jgi:para-aminobenzoate synthetase/4-amino-4-deoxychorismate lyase
MQNYSVITKLQGFTARFENPRQVISLAGSNLEEAFARADAFARAGGYVIALLNYELGEYLLLQGPPEEKLGTFLFYESFSRIAPQKSDSFAITNLRMLQSRQSYAESLELIFEELRAGNSYQVNYTSALEFDFFGEPEALFSCMLERQPTPYNTIVRLDDEYIISASPELFFEQKNTKLTCRPMKGTAPLEKGADFLSADGKNRAENVMIVDLIRNDLNRICDDVRVPALLDVEEHKSLFQMTSTVTGTLRNTEPLNVIKALFPCGSITGAPKISTMKIIRRLEAAPRGIYTGSIGFYHGSDSIHSIAIRTISLARGRGRMGIGGGITISSGIEDEYDEMLLKAAFLTQNTGFAIFETLLWDASESLYKYFDEHLARLGDSARFFAIAFDRSVAEALLAGAAIAFTQSRRVRLSLNASGELSVADFPLTQWKDGPVLLKEVPRRPACFTRHKTTRRLNLPLADVCEYLLHTTDGELLEGSISNLFLLIDGKWFTPPVSSGLLAGIERARFMDEVCAEEKRLYLTDLRRAKKIAFTNSVRSVHIIDNAAGKGTRK